MVSAEFYVKIADFGFSKEIEKVDSLNETICGTPLYMAPQLVEKKEKYTYKSEIWSLGIVFFELLNGATPFQSMNKKEFVQKINVGSYQFK